MNDPTWFDKVFSMSFWQIVGWGCCLIPSIGGVVCLFFVVILPWNVIKIVDPDKTKKPKIGKTFTQRIEDAVDEAHRRNNATKS